MGEHRARFGVLIASLALSSASLAADPAFAAAPARPAVNAANPEVFSPPTVAEPPRSLATGESSAYVLMPMKLDAAGGYREIVRVSDGAVAKTFRVASRTDRAGFREISGSHALWRRTTGGVSSIVAEHLDSGVTTTVPIVAGDKVLAAQPGWVLVSRGQDNPSVHLLRGDGSETKVGNPCPDRNVVNSEDWDAAGVIISCSVFDGHRFVDIPSATLHAAPGWKLTPTRVLGLHQDGDSTTVTWADRTSLGTLHTVDVAAEPTSIVSFGDGVAVQTLEACEQATCDSQLRVVDLETGALGEPVADHVRAVREATDGALTLLLSGGAGGKLAVLHPGDTEPTVFATPPAELAKPGGVFLSGDRVFGQWVEGSGGRVLEYSDGQWIPVIDPGTGEPLTTFARDFGLWVSGDVIAALVSHDATDGDRWRVIWPGGARDVMSDNGMTLGRGGKLISLEKSIGSYEVQDARTGEVQLTTPTRPILDGTWVWVREDDELVGRNTASPGTVRRVRVSITGCEPFAPQDVRGRWATFGCWGGATYVIDLTGGLRPWRTPGIDRFLGNDFVYTSDWDSVEPSGHVFHISAMDFSAQHTSRFIATSLTGPGVDEQSSHRMVHTDLLGRVVLRTLDWVGSPATPDRTAPKLAAVSGSPRYLAVNAPNAAVTYRWRFTDPQVAGQEPAAGVASYRVRYRTKLTKSQSWSAWKELARTGTSLTLRVGVGKTVTFQVRARDKYGNQSAWTGSRYTSVSRRRG